MPTPPPTWVTTTIIPGHLLHIQALSYIQWFLMKGRSCQCAAWLQCTEIALYALLLFTQVLTFLLADILSILKYTLATCTLFLTDRFTHLSVTINTHFFPVSIVLWKKLPADLVWFLILTPLKQESVRSIIHTLKCILFLICF